MSTKDWASSPRRRLTASTSSRSEKISVIKEIRSFRSGGQSIKRFHAGILLHVRNKSGERTRGSRAETYKPRKICDTCGRKEASWSQHRCVNAHNTSVKFGWAGRGGRSPSTIADIASRGDLSLNGTAPVKAYVKVSGDSPDINPGKLLQRTSIVTIANEKTSPSLPYVPRPSKISGAIHRALYPSSSEVPRVESRFWVTIARPKSVTFARPVMSTMIFDWLGVNTVLK